LPKSLDESHAIGKLRLPLENGIGIGTSVRASLSREGKTMFESAQGCNFAPFNM